MGPGDIAFAVLGLVIGYLIGDLIKLTKKGTNGYIVLPRFPNGSGSDATPDTNRRGLLTPRKEK